MSKHVHYWLDTGISSVLVFLDGKWRFDCSVCGKQIWRRNQPVNPLVPSAWDVYEASDKEYTMSPPLVVGNETQFAEGMRYANLVRGGSK